MEPELSLRTLLLLDILLQVWQHFLQAASQELQQLNPQPFFQTLLGYVEEQLQHLDAGVPHRIWRLDTSTVWWDHIVLELWGNQQWIQNFRMKDTFLELCEWLAPALRRRDTDMRPTIPLHKRVAIALWKLSMPDRYRSVGNQFGMGRSTIGVVLMQVVRAINTILLRRIIHLADVDAIIEGFGTLGFPNCGGGYRQETRPYPCPGPPGFHVHQPEGILFSDPAGHD